MILYELTILKNLKFKITIIARNKFKFQNFYKLWNKYNKKVLFLVLYSWWNGISPKKTTIIRLKNKILAYIKDILYLYVIILI